MTNPLCHCTEITNASDNAKEIVYLLKLMINFKWNVHLDMYRYTYTDTYTYVWFQIYEDIWYERDAICGMRVIIVRVRYNERASG